MNFRTVLGGGGVRAQNLLKVFELYMFFSLIFGKNVDYVVSLTGTVAQIKRHNMEWQTRRPLPRYKRLSNTHASACAVGVLGVRSGGTGVQPSTHPHTLQPTLSMHTRFQLWPHRGCEDAGTHEVSLNKKTTTRKAAKLRLGSFQVCIHALLRGNLIKSNDIIIISLIDYRIVNLKTLSFNDINHFVWSSSCHTQTWIRAFIRHTIGKKKSPLGRG